MVDDPNVQLPTELIDRTLWFRNIDASTCPQDIVYVKPSVMCLRVRSALMSYAIMFYLAFVHTYL
jgi:hypothetical protein